MANAKVSDPAAKPAAPKTVKDAQGIVKLPKDYKLPEGVLAKDVQEEAGKRFYVRELASGSKIKTYLL